MWIDHPFIVGKKMLVPDENGTIVFEDEDGTPLISEAVRDALESKEDYVVIKGGRASQKTYFVAFKMVVQSYLQPTRGVIGRKHGSSITESAKVALEHWIDRFGWRDTVFKIGRGKDGTIDNMMNGSHIFGQGLSTRTEEDAKGLHLIDILWIEEGMSLDWFVLRKVLPTIRENGSQIWVTFNPENRSDPVYQHFVENKPDSCTLIHLNYYDNPWLPAKSMRDMEHCRKFTPDLFAWEWLGQLKTGGAERTLLSVADLELAVEAVTSGKLDGFEFTGPRDVGLDVALAGRAENALCVRQGPLIRELRKWHSRDAREVVEAAHDFVLHHGGDYVYFDTGGPGEQLEAEFGRLTHPNGGYWPYDFVPIRFNQQIEGKNVYYKGEIRNRDVFRYLNGQMAFNLRHRLQRTRALMSGADVDPNTCLFIHPDACWNRETGLNWIEQYKGQMTQVEWEPNPLNGMYMIDKAPAGAPSPDAYDATALAFLSDIMGYGLEVY